MTINKQVEAVLAHLRVEHAHEPEILEEFSTTEASDFVLGCLLAEEFKEWEPEL